MDVIELYECRSIAKFETKAKAFIQGVASFPSLDDTEEVALFTHFAFCTYLLDSAQIVFFLDKPIEDLPFINHHTWDWIEPLLLLKVKLGMCAKAKGAERVAEVLESGSELARSVKQEVQQETLRGEYLDLDILRVEYNLQSEVDDVLNIVALAMDLVRIAELGGSEAFPVTRANELLGECKIKFQASFGIV